MGALRSAEKCENPDILDDPVTRARYCHKLCMKAAYLCAAAVGCCCGAKSGMQLICCIRPVYGKPISMNCNSCLACLRTFNRPPYSAACCNCYTQACKRRRFEALKRRAVKTSVITFIREIEVANAAPKSCMYGGNSILDLWIFHPNPDTIIRVRNAASCTFAGHGDATDISLSIRRPSQDLDQDHKNSQSKNTTEPLQCRTGSPSPHRIKDRCPRAQRLHTTSTDRRPRDQEGHDGRLRSDDIETHTLHRAAARQSTGCLA